jgi:hypothetical protein
VRSLLLTKAEVGLAVAVTDVVVVLEDVGVCDTVDVELGTRKRLRTADDRHGVRRAREAQDLVGGRAAATATTTVVTAVPVGRRGVAAKDKVTECNRCEGVTSMVSQLVHRSRTRGQKATNKILNTLHDYLKGEVRRILLVVYLPCREKGGKVSVDSFLRTVKTEFRTHSRFPVGIRTHPTRIPKSCRVVAGLVERQARAPKQQKLSEADASQGTSEGDRPPSGK